MIITSFEGEVRVLHQMKEAYDVAVSVSTGYEACVGIFLLSWMKLRLGLGGSSISQYILQGC